MSESKIDLRRKIVALREGIAPAERTRRGQLITDRLLALLNYQTARSVLAYMSFGSEFNTDNFVRRVLRDGKILHLPKINKAERRLDLYMVSNLEQDLLPGVWGIREPNPARCPPSNLPSIDFVLVPGLVFDRSCNRLGYGAGFYDRLLPSLNQSVSKVAAAFDEQVLQAIPVEAHDVRLNAIVTDREIISHVEARNP